MFHLSLSIYNKEHFTKDFFRASSLTLALPQVAVWKNRSVSVEPSLHQAVLNLTEDVPKRLQGHLHVGIKPIKVELKFNNKR